MKRTDDHLRHAALRLRAALFALPLLFVSAGCAPSTPGACLRQASLRLAEGKIAAAHKLALRAERMAPDDPIVLIFKAIVCERAGERDPALDAARRAVTADPENFIARYTLGRLYAQDPARTADAIRELRQALRLKPGDPDTLIHLCNVSMAMNASYARDFLRMLEATPAGSASSAVQNQLGVLSCRRGNYAAAKQIFLRAVKYGRCEPEAIFNLARFFDCHTKEAKTTARFYRAFLRVSVGRDDLAALRESASARLAAIETPAGR